MRAALFGTRSKAAWKRGTRADNFWLAAGDAKLDERCDPMPPITQDSLVAIQQELMSGESVVWTGRPKTNVVFHSEDTLLIPFSLMWGGFAVFWEMVAAGIWHPGTFRASPSWFVLWGIPFVVVGQYLIWGRFVYAAWKKKRTYYAVTNRRVIVVQDGWKRRTASAFVDTLPALTKEGGSGKCGTLRFAQSEPVFSRGRGWQVWDAMAIGNVPVFVDVEDVDSVYRLVSELRDRASLSRSNRA
jgi:hypothetical protein